jgi:hypothetical protein
MPAHLYPSEQLVADAFNKIAFHGDSPSSDCALAVQKTMCALADPWAGSLVAQQLVSLCPSYAAKLWDLCSSVVMAPSPFSLNGAACTLRDLYKTEAAFAAAYANRDAGSECYNGVPVDTMKPVPPHHSGQACLQRMKFNLGKGQILVGGAPYPTGISHQFFCENILVLFLSFAVFYCDC